MSPTEKKHDSHGRNGAGPILLLTMVFFLNFTARVSLAPLLPTMEKDLGLSHGEVGSLFLMISIGYLITMMTSGFISLRLGHRRCIIIAATIGGGAMLIAGISTSLISLYCSTFLLGVSAGLYLPSGIATLTSQVREEHWGRALAVHETAPNLGMILAPFIAEAFVSWISWRAGLFILGGLALASGAIYFRYGPKTLLLGQAPELSAVGPIFRQIAFWHILVVFGLAVGGSMGLYSMMPLYLVSEHGFARGWANTLVALSRIPGLFTAYVGGWLADRAGVKWGMVVILLLSGSLVVSLGVVSSQVLVIIIFFQTSLAASFFPIGFAAMAHLGRPEERSLIVSLAMAQSYLLGAGLVPAFIGLIGEKWSFSVSVVVTGILVLLGAISLVFFKLPKPTNQQA